MSILHAGIKHSYTYCYGHSRYYTSAALLSRARYTVFRSFCWSSVLNCRCGVAIDTAVVRKQLRCSLLRHYDTTSTGYSTSIACPRCPAVVVLADGFNGSNATPPKTNERVPRPGAAESKAKRRVSWASTISWLAVLAVSLVYRFVADRQVVKRELPREDDIFIVSYPKSGE